MKDVRCILFRHRWHQKRVEDSVYYECSRCHDIRDPGGVPPGVTLLGP